MSDTQRKRQRHKQAPHREPDAGLNPKTPGSLLEPKADAQPLRHPGVPHFLIPNSLPWASLKNLLYIFYNIFLNSPDQYRLSISPGFHSSFSTI